MASRLFGIHSEYNAALIICSVLYVLSAPPSKIYLPLNVILALSFTWSINWSNSFWIIARSSSVLVSLAAFMAFSFMVRIISTVLLKAPSATLNRLLAFCVLSFAWSSALICTRIFSDMEKPEASSAALFIFMPEATFFRLLDNALLFLFNLFNVCFAGILFFTTIAMKQSPPKKSITFNPLIR